MGFLYTLKKIFSKRAETKEDHVDEKLRTHYYKTTKDRLVKELEEIINNQKGFEIKSYAENHGELVVEINKGKRAIMVITVIMVKPFRTAVDFSVTSETGIITDFGASRKLIYFLYEDLNKKFELVGTGLGNELMN
ncbi:DUF1499 domain-containing protein [Evansella sp. AB-P1]|uniref:DUF1499 domain-containing protein n=1 Tax=Evansella sp. AB-P1 TaxID=3037653 RepID=UPI00241D0498|nr:DUF1499 domain-containing protein [Evansella sp. AB-P1]MDG5786962.1 DUF1499 domain-containing protein [Evansella sp. AB-P1]